MKDQGTAHNNWTGMEQSRFLSGNTIQTYHPDINFGVKMVHSDKSTKYWVKGLVVKVL